MITVKDIADKSMTPEKKESAQNDLFAFYIGRPISYVLTIPFIYTNISPNAISLLSIAITIIGFIIACIAKTKAGMVISWSMLFLWNLLDAVDGNVARYKKQFLKMGSVYDAMAGYLAASMMFFAAAIMAAHANGPLVSKSIISPEALIIIGGITAMVNMFPRLIMHKTITTLMNKGAMSEINEKKNYGIAKVIVLNLKSCAGGAQVLFLIAVLCNILDLYTVCYFLFNLTVMIVTLKTILKGDSK